MSGRLSSLKSKFGLMAVAGAVLAAGVTSAALAAQSQSGASPCYGKCASKTSLSLSTHKVFYGKEQNEVFSVSVASGVAGVTRTPTGTVAVKYGTTVLCKITLLNGKGSCSPAPKALPIRVKAYWIKAHYNGNSFFLPSTSLGRSLTVVK